MTIEGIPLGIADVAPTGLLTIFISGFLVALAKGWIVVKLHYDSVERSRDYWRGVAEKAVDALHLLSQATDKNATATEATVKVMATLQEFRQEAERKGSDV